MKAIIFVDVQKDFIDGVLKNEQAIAVTPKIIEFAKKCVNEDFDDCMIYATRDTHEKTKYNVDLYGEGTPYSGYMTTLEGKKIPEHCIEGTDGWMINEDLLDAFHIGYSDENQPTFACTFVNKPTFGSEDLGKIIAEDFENKRLDEIILCGFCTGICVLANAIALRMKFPNTKITVMKDLCACVTPESHKNALEALKLQQIDIV